MSASEPEPLEVLAAVAGWARPHLVGDAPVFGSGEWCALEPNDPRRATAVVRAALAWWRVGEPLEDEELHARAAVARETSAAVWEALGRGGREQASYHPMYAELLRRRRSHGALCRCGCREPVVEEVRSRAA